MAWEDDCLAVLARLRSSGWQVWEERTPSGKLDMPYLLASFEAGVPRSETLDNRQERLYGGAYVVCVSNDPRGVRGSVRRVRGLLEGWAPGPDAWELREVDLRTRPAVDDAVSEDIRYGQTLYFKMRGSNT